jgi:hypothetical protein
MQDIHEKHLLLYILHLNPCVLRGPSPILSLHYINFALLALLQAGKFLQYIV